MQMILDSDVQAVTEFMQERVSANRLVAVARCVSEIAPLLWGKYEPEQVQALRLEGIAPTAVYDLRTQPASTV